MVGDYKPRRIQMTGFAFAAVNNMVKRGENALNQQCLQYSSASWSFTLYRKMPTFEYIM